MTDLPTWLKIVLLIIAVPMLYIVLKEFFQFHNNDSGGPFDGFQ